MKAQDKSYTYKCNDCGMDISVVYTTHLRWKNNGIIPRCKKCDYIHRGKVKKEWYNNLSQSEKDKYIKINSDSHKKSYDSKSPEEKKKIQENMKKVQLNFNNGLSKKEKKEMKHKRKLGLESYLKNLTEEERKTKVETALQNLQVVFDNKDKYREMWSNSAKERYSIMSDEEKIEFMQKIWDGHKEWYESLSDEEKSEFHKNTILKRSEWYSSLSNEEKQRINNKIKISWDMLSSEERSERIKSSIISSNGDNKFHQKFCKRFNESYLSNRFYLIPEESLYAKDFTKAWDYGIYSKETNNLEMVVDLDGSFNHGDNSDYNGLHSREEYDERRLLTVPSHIKCFIINDFQFNKSFELMLNALITDNKKYIKNQFNMCRMLSGMPYLSYSDIELAKSWNQLTKMDCCNKYRRSLSLNNREGDRLINHFHHSIYQASRRGRISPYEAWYDDKLLKDVIRNRMIYINTINPNKILQGFNASHIAPRVSVFSAGRAKLLIHKYLNDMNEIFDPFSGFSGRMLGAISLGKRYIGQDISEIHVKESSMIIEFIKSIGVSPEVYLQQKNILYSTGEYECLFTCSPYSDKEKWFEVKTIKKSCDDWIYECLSRFKCKKYLFVVDNTEKYKDYIVDEIINKSHFGTNKEYVILIKREG